MNPLVVNDMTFDGYPWTRRRFDRGDGIEMNYLDEGQGETLVLLHGNPTWSYYWRHLVAGLTDRYRCVVPDHVGMGLSDKPGDDRYAYTLQSRVDDLTKLFDHLGLGDDLTLVAHDWGGMIGLAWAVTHPGRVKRFVLANTAGFRLPATGRLPWQLWLVKNLPMAVPVRGFNAFVRGAARACSTRPGAMDAQTKRAYVAPYDSWSNRIAIHRFVQDIPLKPTDPAWPLMTQVEDALPGLNDLPVQILCGRKDFVFDDHFLAEWRARLPEAEFHVWDDCGHYVCEDARDEITPLVRDFLERNPLTAGEATA